MSVQALCSLRSILYLAEPSTRVETEVRDRAGSRQEPVSVGSPALPSEGRAAGERPTETGPYAVLGLEPISVGASGTR